MKFKGCVISNMDGYEEGDGECWDVYEVLIKAKSLKNWGKLRMIRIVLSRFCPRERSEPG